MTALLATALGRYRLMAWVVGALLLVLVFVAMPVKYLGHDRALVAVVGPVHGLLYIVYLVAAGLVALQRRWPLGRLALVVLAGFVPFLSFVVERKVTAEERARPGVEVAG